MYSNYKKEELRFDDVFLKKKRNHVKLKKNDRKIDKKKFAD